MSLVLAPDVEPMIISGRISYQEIEGGFWGIIGNDGSKYYPIDGLPKAFQKEGFRVRAELEVAHMIGTTMWGQYVKISSISPDTTATTSKN
jgi:inhibitor of cysteine peptidase